MANRSCKVRSKIENWAQENNLLHSKQQKTEQKNKSGNNLNIDKYVWD